MAEKNDISEGKMMKVIEELKIILLSTKKNLTKCQYDIRMTI